mmetsp:Transcript_18122/g.38011  ORF Transcript_18122/g.38011 Transcript_18122/m.38011 type:complete len:214 (+) Transcript_18122:763-1404(+)
MAIVAVGRRVCLEALPRLTPTTATTATNMIMSRWKCRISTGRRGKGMMTMEGWRRRRRATTTMGTVTRWRWRTCLRERTPSWTKTRRTIPPLPFRRRPKPWTSTTSTKQHPRLATWPSKSSTIPLTPSHPSSRAAHPNLSCPRETRDTIIYRGRCTLLPDRPRSKERPRLPPTRNAFCTAGDAEFRHCTTMATIDSLRLYWKRNRCRNKRKKY